MAWPIMCRAVNAWDGRIGEVAIFANGGWVFMTPKAGWRAWIEDIGVSAMFDGLIWREGLVAMSPGGAGSNIKLIEFDHVLSFGWDNDTSVVIEDAMLVQGVTGRILSDITGNSIVDWKLGVAGSTARYGGGFSLTAGTWIKGMAYKPQTYWGGEPLKLTATGGEFTGGTVRLAIHGVTLDPALGGMMRPVLHGDVVAAARALLAVEAGARAGLIRRLISQAGWADRFRRTRGRVHPFWGDGSLEVAAAQHVQMPEPYLDAPDYCECMIAVFEALLGANPIHLKSPVDPNAFEKQTPPRTDG